MSIKTARTKAGKTQSDIAQAVGVTVAQQPVLHIIQLVQVQQPLGQRRIDIPLRKDGA